MNDAMMRVLVLPPAVMVAGLFGANLWRDMTVATVETIDPAPIVAPADTAFSAQELTRRVDWDRLETEPQWPTF